MRSGLPLHHIEPLEQEPFNVALQSSGWRYDISSCDLVDDPNLDLTDLEETRDWQELVRSVVCPTIRRVSRSRGRRIGGRIGRFPQTVEW